MDISCGDDVSGVEDMSLAYYRYVLCGCPLYSSDAALVEDSIVVGGSTLVIKITKLSALKMVCCAKQKESNAHRKPLHTITTIVSCT